MNRPDGIARTAEHYSKQWGAELDFASFVKADPEAAKIMPSRQLPWQALFDRIRARAAAGQTRVYDAACGFGDVLNSLASPDMPRFLHYIGADIHGALGTIAAPPGATLVQADICAPLAGHGPFDFIVCRSAIHHTPDPPATYRVLAAQLAPGGTLAITAYAKKAPMREAVDDELRRRIVPLPNEEAFAIANQFTALGRDLQAATGEIVIREDLQFLGIKAGSYGVQEFVYRYFMKCWHNRAFSERHCDIVNFDWYHPPYAYRYEAAELRGWAEVAIQIVPGQEHAIEDWGRIRRAFA
jgi:SAM-dependent methyltransferase